MHQKDDSIIKKMNIQTDAVIVNQTDHSEVRSLTFTNLKGRLCSVTFVSSEERGLSKSRNMAISYAKGADICLICDEDEVLYDNYEDIISAAYSQNPNKSLIAFKFHIGRNPDGRNVIFPNRKKKIGYWSSHGISSVQISFNYHDVCQHNIRFDETVGAGVTFSGGEENIFMHDCMKNCMKMIYLPEPIAVVAFEGSTWVSNRYTEQFFEDFAYARGREVYGKTFAAVFSVYYAFKKRRFFKGGFSVLSCILRMWKGVYRR